MNLAPKWVNLIVAVLSAVLGWLSTIVVPVPGNVVSSKPVPIQIQK